LRYALLNRDETDQGSATGRKNFHSRQVAGQAVDGVTRDTQACRRVARKHKGSTFPAIPPGPDRAQGPWGLQPPPKRPDHCPGSRHKRTPGTGTALKGAARREGPDPERRRPGL
jgi:hypothetical protein